MKTIQLSRPLNKIPATGAAADTVSYHTSGKNLTTASRAAGAGTTPVHSGIFKTVVGVLGEGLKQNFLGSDINMEYLTLTVRSYASSTIKKIRHMLKPLNVRQHLDTHQQFNQPTY